MSAEKENVNAELESLLQSFTPVPPRLDRDRVMFLAGAASVQASRVSSRTTKPWLHSLAIAGGAAAAAVVLTFAVRGAPSPRIVYVERSAPPASTAEIAPSRSPEYEPESPANAASNLHLRQLALVENWDAAAASPAIPGTSLESAPATRDTLQRQILEPTDGVFPRAGRM